MGISDSVRNNIIKALTAYSKYNGQYELFKNKLKNCGIHYKKQSALQPDETKDSLKEITKDRQTMAKFIKLISAMIRNTMTLFTSPEALAWINQNHSEKAMNELVKTVKAKIDNANLDEIEKLTRFLLLTREAMREQLKNSDPSFKI